MTASNVLELPSVFFSSLSDLEVKIESERTFILSYKEEDFEHCVSLYGDKNNTKYFDSGKPRSREEVTDLVLEKGRKYFSVGRPFGLFSIFEKTTMKFIGQIDLLPLGEAGTVEVGFIIGQKFQNKGYCTEAVQTVVFNYVEELNYRFGHEDEFPIKRVIATAHPENIPSQRVLQKTGMRFDKLGERFGNLRMWYSMPTSFPIKNNRKATTSIW